MPLCHGVEVAGFFGGNKYRGFVIRDGAARGSDPWVAMKTKSGRQLPNMRRLWYHDPMSKQDDVHSRTNPPRPLGAAWVHLAREIEVDGQTADCGLRRASGRASGGRAPGDHFLRHAHCSPSRAPFLLGADRGWLQGAWEGAA